jgi:hypothetical protein
MCLALYHSSATKTINMAEAEKSKRIASRHHEQCITGLPWSARCSQHPLLNFTHPLHTPWLLHTTNSAHIFFIFHFLSLMQPYILTCIFMKHLHTTDHTYFTKQATYIQYKKALACNHSRLFFLFFKPNTLFAFTTSCFHPLMTSIPWQMEPC